jgi:serine/threonine-protein kinase HipA
MTDELCVLVDGIVIARLLRRKGGRLLLHYDREWREAGGAFPLSLSMPLAAGEHDNKVVEPFLWGLLPDNETVLQRWGAKYQVSPRNVFDLISHVGEDCAGAAQFVPIERLDEVLSGANDQVDWLSDADIERRLRTLREDHAAWRLPRDTGQFSLAGAQPKTALLYEDGRWGVPSGRIPTTHIFKPPTGQIEGHAENEHYCLDLGRALGLPTVTSRVARFGDELAIIIERYDRLRTEDGLKRIHQEDVCQALGVMPQFKYQNQGGPGVLDMIELLRTHSSAREEDPLTFVDAVGFNWLIAGTDAHAKNYSLLIGRGQYVRLAPLYDLASFLPYDETKGHKIKLSMKIGDEYALSRIRLGDWEALARNARMDPNVVLMRLRAMVERMPDEALNARGRAHADGLELPLIDRLADTIAARARECLKLFG